MRVDDVVGHGDTVQRLWRAARDGRLSHALCFEGPSGIGKFRAMAWFALGLLCEAGPGEPCLACGACKRVRSGGTRSNHPDLLVIDPTEDGEESIRLFRIAHRPDAPGNDEPERCVEHFLALRAMEAGFRPVLIREAQRMNGAAQNALLKTLEEPRPGTLLCLETDRAEALLPTIVSRCVRLRLTPLACEDEVAVLEEHGVPRARAEALATWSGGSPGRALAAEARGLAEVLAALDAAVSGVESAPTVAAGLWELEGDFPGTTPGAKARARARFVCELALEVVRDVERHAAGVAERHLAHGTLVGRIAAAGAWPAARRREVLDELLACRRDVDRNLAPEAVVERALLALGSPALDRARGAG